MGKTVDYYFSPISPWSYLGHARFAQMLARHGAQVNVKPMDLGKVFPVSGGLPLPQRAPQRQAYRLVELQRWRDYLKVPLTIKPKFFPAASDLAATMIVAVKKLGEDQAMRLTGAILAACWTQERNVADADTLRAIAREQALDADALLTAAQSAETKAAYDQFTAEAIERQVFGAPTYVVDGVLFWGQDRLDFVDRALSA
jgi:2-hydroxychromene-2-carboxylate isomerase